MIHKRFLTYPNKRIVTDKLIIKILSENKKTIHTMHQQPLYRKNSEYLGHHHCFFIYIERKTFFHTSQKSFAGIIFTNTVPFNPGELEAFHKVWNMCNFQPPLHPLLS